MKKLIALILSLFLISSMSVNVFAAATLSKEDGTLIGETVEKTNLDNSDEIVDNTNYEKWERLEMLYTLGAVDEETIAYSDLDEEISKGLFIYLLGNLCYYNINHSASSAGEYNDVGINHYISEYAELMTAAGILSGDGSGNLDTGKSLSIEEAYKLVVCALGYGYRAEQLGGWPNGYVIQAVNLKLNVDYDGEKGFTKRNAVELLANMIDAETMVIKNSKIQPGGKFSAEIMGLTKGDGIVYSAGGTSISEYEKVEFVAVIGPDMLDDPNKIAFDYLGKRVEYYYDKEATLIYLREKQNTVINIKSEDIDAVDSGEINYYENNKLKKVKISSEISIVKNGKAAASFDDLVPSYGDVALIDNNNDEKYDVAFVNEYDVYYIKSISAERDILRVVNGSGERVIKTDDYNRVVVKDKDGNEQKLRNIKEDKVIMVREAEDYLQITLCSSTLQGRISAVETDTNSYTYTIITDSEEETQKAYIKALYGIYYDGIEKGRVSSVTATVFLDIYGNAAAVLATDSADTLEWKLGYLLSVRYDDEEEMVIFKIGDKYAEFTNYYTGKKKLLVDGERVNIAKTYAALETKVFVRYKAKDHEIVGIDMPLALTFFDDANRRITDTEDNCLYKRVSGYQNRVNHNYTFINTLDEGYASGSIFAASDCITYSSIVKRSEISSASEEDISKVTTSFTDAARYDMDGYSIGKDNLRTNAFIIYDLSAASSGGIKESKAMVVTENIYTIDENDEVGWKVSGKLYGSDVTYFVQEDLKKYDNAEAPYTVKNFSEIKRGDVIRFTVDRYSKIDYCVKEYTADGTGRLNELCYNESSPMAVNRYMLVNLLGYSNNVLAFRARDNSLPAEMITVDYNYMRMYLYDRHTKKLRSATTDDIYFAVSDPDFYEAIILGSYQQQSRDLIFITK